MKESKKQKKVGKVMREFKSGTLKSGGSGKKVTNPKQAIAIALSEANAMNQGGMMQNPVMQRPMFQNPMQRESMGIMAGVAPIQGYREGGSAAPDYTPKFLRDEQPEEDSMGRMLFELFVVDPDDPVDVGMASASAAMVAAGITAPAAIATQLARMGYKGKKLYNLINKVEGLGKSSKENAGIVSKAMAPVTATYGASQTGRLVGEAPEIVEAAGGLGDLVRDSATEGIAKLSGGGIAQLSGGGFLEGIMSALIPKRLETAGKILERAIDAGRATFDDIVDAFKRGEIDEKQLTDLNKKLPEGDQGRFVKQGEILDLKTKQISNVGDDGVDITRGVDTIDTPIGPLQKAPDSRVKMTEGDLSTPTSTPSKPTQMVEGDIAPPPKSVEVPKTTVTEKAADAVKQPITQRVRQSVPGQIVSGALSPITRPLKVGVPVLAGGVALDRLLQSGKIQEAYDLMINDPRVKKVIDNFGVPAAEAAKEIFGPYYDALFPDTGERVELTDSVMEQVDIDKDGKISKAESEAIKKKADEAVEKQQTGTSTGTPKPEATGLMKFLFGKDGIGGEPGVAGKALEMIQDPRFQYQAARAGQATEGRVPRNFFSDFALAGAEYDQLRSSEKTALMQNYDFLKEAGKTDDEIFDLLLKDSGSNLGTSEVLSLFDSISDTPKGQARSTSENVAEAITTAARIEALLSGKVLPETNVVATVDVD